jgi:hypothetical protein
VEGWGYQREICIFRKGYSAHNTAVWLECTVATILSGLVFSKNSWKKSYERIEVKGKGLEGVRAITMG